LAWVAAAAAPAFFGATLTQGLMVLNNDSYTPERWHSTLLYVAVVLSAIMVNVSTHRKYLRHSNQPAHCMLLENKEKIHYR